MENAPLHDDMVRIGNICGIYTAITEMKAERLIVGIVFGLTPVLIKKDLDDASFPGKPGKNRSFKIQRIPPRRVQEICKRVCGKIDKK